jgi:hypothetical protein
MFVLSAAYRIQQSDYSSRFQVVGRNVYEAILGANEIDWFTLSYQGGVRQLTGYVGFYSLQENWGLGHGIGSWITEFDRIAQSAGVIFSNYPVTEAELYLEVVKPCSFVSTVALDLGLPGMVLMTVFLGSFIWGRGRGSVPPSVFAMRSGALCLAMFYLFFAGLITLPMPWLLLLYAQALMGSEQNQWSAGECGYHRTGLRWS